MDLTLTTLDALRDTLPALTEINEFNNRYRGFLIDKTRGHLYECEIAEGRKSLVRLNEYILANKKHITKDNYAVGFCYGLLSDCYMNKKQVTKAKQVLIEGLELYPDNERLIERLYKLNN